ncbi:MAG: ATP-dependent sacrificial sulfur transferase LarE [Eubacterium sp.]|nr:ATP-dependent sacrificial sulfur transferase LarE [Eubacterium sp.]
MDINEFFAQYDSVALAFSGGVDSALVLALAKRYAKCVKAYFVKSQFQPEFELNDAKATAQKLGADLTVIEYDILQNKSVTANPENRCYYCKRDILGAIKSAANADGFNTLLDGTNASDNADDRPGTKALNEFGILSPLKLCGITKSEVRRLARENGLEVHNKPSYACLATRIPTGEVITATKLSATEKAENELFKLGFKNFRVRYSPAFAKLEMSGADMKLLSQKKQAVLDALKPYYNSVLLDLNERKDDE